MLVETQKLKKWEQNISQYEHQIAFHVAKMKPICFDISPCGTIISIGYTNKNIIFWDFVNCQQLSHSILPFEPAQIFYSEDGKFLLIRPKSAHKTMYLYNSQTMNSLELRALENCYYGKIVEFRADPHYAIILGLTDISIIQFDQATAQHQIDFQYVSISFVKNKILMGFINCHEDRGELGIRLIKTGKIMRRAYLAVVNGDINLHISNNTALIVSSNRSKNRVWNVQTMKLIRKKCYGQNCISELNMNKQSSLVYFILSTHGIVVWNVCTGRHKIVVKDQKCKIQSLKVVKNCHLIFKRGWQIHSVICH